MKAAVDRIFARFEQDCKIGWRRRHSAAYGEFAGRGLKIAEHIAIHFARDGKATIYAGDSRAEAGTPGARRIIRLASWPTPAEAVELLAEHFAELAAHYAATRAERREFLREFWQRNTPDHAERLLGEFDAETEKQLC